MTATAPLARGVQTPPTGRGTPQPGTPVRGRRRPSLPAWAGYAVVLMLLGFFALASPHFLSGTNITTVLNQASVIAIAGMGLAIVIITGGDDVLNGGIDLSIAAVAGLAGTVTAVATASGASSGLAIAAGLGTSLLIGIVNGSAVVLGLRPLLTTLATMGIATSLELVVSENIKVPLDRGVFGWLREADIVGIPVPVLIMVAIGLIAGWGLEKTSWGVNSYAVGDNPTAAAVAGISTPRYRWASYLVSSGLGGLAGILLASRLSAAVPGIGAQILLDIILVAYMSTVFSRRLVVTIPGTLVAAVFVAGLSNGLTLLGVASQWTGAAKGVLILLVLAVVVIRGKKAAS